MPINKHNGNGNDNKQSNLTEEDLDSEYYNCLVDLIHTRWLVNFSINISTNLN